jgi:predicted dehydrogenase
LLMLEMSTLEMSKQKIVKVGIIGGGLMGRELLALVGRWDALLEHPIRPVITAIADTSDVVREFFTNAGVSESYGEYKELLASPNVDVVYIAVPHHLHEEIYIATINSGKDFLGEKPFGIDLAAAEKIAAALAGKKNFVRVSSELPFYPGAQAAVREVLSGNLGEIVEVRSGLLHSSDIDRKKKINWKRQRKFCGDIGVLGDLGMHAAHIPLRLGYKPTKVFAILDDIVTHRESANGEEVACDTFDNAVLAMRAKSPGDKREFPMFWEMKRIAPGESNTFFFSALGMTGGVRFSTKNPAVYHTFALRNGEQVWSEIQPGHVTNWPVITGHIFEFGFPDALLQMWAAYFAEREGKLGDRFACASVEEVINSHKAFAAAMKSHQTRTEVAI